MANRYSQLIEKVFFNSYRKGDMNVLFLREEIEIIARKISIKLPKNIGDILYSFRFRNELPKSISQTAPDGYEWLIKLAGRGVYQFSLEEKLEIIPNSNLTFTKILDSTPGVINKYSFTDEQALLAILRYNRLIDIFLGIACYSLQNHLRTTVPNLGQVETDEVYIGIDKKGVHYIVPIQAKAGNDKQGRVQIEQDIELCKNKFPKLICVPIAAQFMSDGKIALFSFEHNEGIKMLSERHYKLVPPSEFSEEELLNYMNRT